jgi:hypothetical protein
VVKHPRFLVAVYKFGLVLEHRREPSVSRVVSLHYFSVGEMDTPAEAVGGVGKEGLAGAGGDFSSCGPPLEFVQLC